MINLSGIPSIESRSFFLGWGKILAYIYTLSILSCGTVDTSKPDEGRFSIDVLAEALDEPMGMTVLPGEKVLIVERRGALKMYDPFQKVIKTIAVIPVNVDVSVGGGYTKQVEEGLMGVIAHPDFEKNHWIFIYHADTAAPRHLLSRWEFKDDQLVSGSQKVVMQVPISREVFKCSGGSMAFDKQGNLYLAVGTNTHYIDTDTMFTPAGEIIVNTNEPETAGNTNDLRGKILRIHPNDDGSYTVPEGNLFTEKDNKVRPEIYVMGVRNPWRISIDSKTGYLFWADPGRDDDKEDVAKNNGKGMDEFNVATGPGNYGWPFFVGDNRPYYAPIHSTSGQPFSPGSISNTSSRNTGWERLPSARSSIIQYKYSVSDAFPLVGGGGRSAVGGPVFRSADFSKAARPFPSYYEGKWFVTDFIRGWIMLVEVDRKGKYVSMEPFLPQEHFSSVLDMQFSPEGDLYLLQYGTGWFTQNSNARLVKISYQSGNRKPVAKALVDKPYASTSAKIHLNGRESDDPDGDSLKYHWFIQGNTHSSERQGCEVSLSFDAVGIYDVRLVVTDPSGATSEDALRLHIGNAQPEIDIDIVQGNETFYFPGDTIRYAIEVRDAEEGSTRDLSIPSSSVERSIEYFSMAHRTLYDHQKVSHESISSWLTPGGVLINNSDCRSCHTQDKPSIGPSYESISRRYRGKEEAISSLAQKIISGGSGIWGDQAMSAHPHLTQSEAEQMTAYILSLGNESKNRTIPLTGEYIVPAFPAQSAGKGSMVIQAAYKDRGTSGMESVQGYAFHLLRNPSLDPEDADIKKGMRVVVTPGREVLMEGNGAHAGFRSIDLARLSKVEVTVIADLWRDMAGGQIECRLDSLSGPLVGISRVITATEKDGTHTVDFIFSDHSMKGKRDVYFVFINRRASPKQLLMELSGIRFIK